MKTALYSVVLLCLAAFAGTASGVEILSVLEVEIERIDVDSIVLATSSGSQTVATPGYGGEPGETDSAALGDHEWPERVIIHWLYKGNPAEPWEITGVRPDVWFDFPVFEGPRIKFLDLGAIEEGPGRALPTGISIAPNPFTASTVIRCELPAPGRATVDVYDASGRFVRSLASADNAFAWDGRDASGERVQPGVYLARVAAGSEPVMARVVLAD